MARHNDLGRRGEQIAVNYLKEKGYTILKQNWFYEKYEVDIIAWDREYIIFVEVKTRTSDMWGNPEEAISASKIKRIVDAADFYITENDTDLEIRFDVIAVIIDKGDIKVEHFEDAFLPPVN
jgi:putative endonuclease